MYARINNSHVRVTVLHNLDIDGVPTAKVEDIDGNRYIVPKSDLIEKLEGKEPEEELQGFKVSPCRDLRPGHLFRPIAGSGPRYNGEPVGRTGRFTCRKIWRKGDRTYVQAMSNETGGLYDLYIDGPAYESTPGTVVQPYRLKILN